MPRKLRDREEGAFHHVFVRGNRKDEVFLDDEDRGWFLERLLKVEAEANSLHVAHCLMTNHFHLLIRPGGPDVSRLLQRVLGAYTQWFNRRHGLVGHLFQGRFGSRVIDSDIDLLWILRYIHRNPVEAGMVPHPELWKWSSHADFLRPVPPPHLGEGVAYSRRLLSEDPARALVLYRRLVERADGDYLVPLPSEARREAHGDRPGWAPKRPSLDEVADMVATRYGIERGALRGHGRSPGEKGARRSFCHSAAKRWGFTLAEISVYLGRSISRVSELSSGELEGTSAAQEGRGGG